ncbi:hypothetical protein JAAARDRAFT_479764 [Jaapia argillacea MUCL 33604]|uniref:Uncharacterized protein n=1 Tax=Jaapia argillacea MUCL 33604 TaxID=933084 RepID=A0A067PCE1_9AGAM|nr:hypothetical protein JAAARDRAFT_479764 [Jaapia argillacea MUCL 33604]
MPSQEPRILLDFGDEDLLEVVCQFGSTHSFDDDSSFISDQPGPGRTVDKIISVAGRRLENALSSISERLGRGPNVAMGRCLAAADRAWLSHFPDWHHPIHSSGFLRRPPPSTQLLEDAFSNIRWGTPELVHDQTFIDSCRSLISYLKCVLLPL